MQPMDPLPQPQPSSIKLWVPLSGPFDFVKTPAKRSHDHSMNVDTQTTQTTAELWKGLDFA